jgi:hypothetical protein
MRRESLHLRENVRLSKYDLLEKFTELQLVDLRREGKTASEKVLNEYLASKKASRSLRLFPMPRNEEKQLWKVAKEKTGLNITRQRLREWFCCEMALLSVSDRYIDSFYGRTPKTILARNHTDYSPDKLKQIYDKANLKVLA